jgi:hypothetical protein
MAAFPALPVNVTTALIEDAVPIAVFGNEKAAGLTVNCNGAGAVAAPKEPELELPELEPEPDDGVLTLGASGTNGRGRLLQPAVSAIDASITAIESQWLR